MKLPKFTGDLKNLMPGKNEKTTLSGLPLPAVSWLAANLSAQNRLFILAPTALEAEDLAGDLGFFLGEAAGRLYPFPAMDNKPFMSLSSSTDAVAARQVALHRLSGGNHEPMVMVASAQAALRLTPTPSEVNSSALFIEYGQDYPLSQLTSFLVENGYNQVGQVESLGDFAVRGGLIDIFPPRVDRPVRLEFFGDQITSIRAFRVSDQRSVEKMDTLTILPVSEIKSRPDLGEKAAQKIERMAKEHGWHDLVWGPLAQRFRLGDFFSGLESWSPMFNGPLTPLSTHLKNTQVLVYEPERFAQAAEAAWLGLVNHFDRLALEGRPHLPLEQLYQRPDKFLAALKPDMEVRTLAFDSGLENQPNPSIHLPIEVNTGLKAQSGPSARAGAGLLGPLAARLKVLLGRALKVNLVLRTQEQSRRLAEMLAEYDLAPAGGLKGKAAAGELKFTVGQLSSGFAADFAKTAYIAEDEIFGPKARARRRATEEIQGLSFASLKDLSPGDFVVHNAHGIGQYLGLVTLAPSSGPKGDFLHLSYKGGDKLYVPVERLSAIGKYVGATDRPPAMDRLGGLTWEKLKGKVKENIRQMAEELLNLYAKRQLTPGHAFSRGDALYREFEAAFAYEETPDQAKAIEAVLEDLTSPKPMDRLICGDVGYGKTEVAMRAAFKAVQDGKQVAVLVPTTILAEQHGQTFAQRLAPWPMKVACISRFKKPAEQKKILADLAAGQVDILVGTHRVLQKDVKFKDLGLIVIDEEHRFGVSDKEKLKKMRTSVDVLSMSATPIPRSLSMSLAGIRDLSSIETPPQDRLSVKTTLLKYDDEAVCEAIDRELARGGQVFLIHNRVKDIHLLAAKLKRLMPLVNFGIGHGQMKEEELEEVMLDFLNRKIDVWITTTIVESGLDFPQANTIIIDQADRFGLAQLYQLRGRVGRGHVQAYAYLMVDSPEILTADAQKRLKAILDNSDLGSGYQIAMHDLQIRGSGNILGAAQSGQASLVGYEMYTQLMEQAISELKGETYEEEIEPEVIMGLPAYLPETYAPDTQARLIIYRRLAEAKSPEALSEVISEMHDRFGHPTPEVINLQDMMEIKLALKKARVKRFESGAGGLTLTFVPEGPPNYDKIMSLVTDPAHKTRLTPEGRLFIADLTYKIARDADKIKQFLAELV